MVARILLAWALMLACVVPAIAGYSSGPRNALQTLNVPGVRKVQSCFAETGTTLRQIGAGAPTATGTASAHSSDLFSHFINYASSGAGTGTAGWTVFASGKVTHLPIVYYRIKTGAAGDITNCRILAGISAFGNSLLGSDDPTGDYANASYCPASDTAFWQFRTNDNSGGALKTATTLAITAETVYNFAIDFTDFPTSVSLYGSTGQSDPVWLATHTANLPRNIALATSTYAVIGETAAEAKNLRVSNITSYGY